MSERKSFLAKIFGVVFLASNACGQESSLVLQTIEPVEPNEFFVSVVLQPVRRSTVAALAAGRVEKVGVEIGREVKREELVVQLSNEEANARLDVARRRLSAMRDSGAASPGEGLAVELEVKLAELAVQESRVRVPFAGRVDELFVSEGDFLRVGAPIAVVSDSTTLVADVPIARGSYAKGDKMPIEVEGKKGIATVLAVGALQGELTRLNRLGGGTASARVVVDGALFAPGQVIASPLIPDEPIARVPSQAVRVIGPNTFLAVFRQGEDDLRFVDVVVAGRSAKGVRVFGKLRDGDQVVVQGPEWLAEGTTRAEATSGVVSGQSVAPNRQGGAAAPKAAAPAAAAPRRRAN
ncbi:MAG: efflux RND transporter periplasmic adaptor subunit [Planctomycetia bacterium]